jgi:hypothetical protein
MAGYVHMETWVRNGTNGIGISDHQNRYSNGVRVGNWAENEFGDRMQAGGIEPPVFTTTTTAADSYRAYEKDLDDRRVTKIGNASNVEIVSLPQQTARSRGKDGGASRRQLAPTHSAQQGGLGRGRPAHLH